MKILFVTASQYQASETFIRNKIEGLIANGCRVEILTHDRNKFFFNNDKKNIKVIYSPTTYSYIKLIFYSCYNIIKILKLLSFQRKFKFATKVKNAIKAVPMTRDYDIIYFTFSGIGIQYLQVLPFLDSKVVFSCRGSAEKVVPFFDSSRSVKLKELGDVSDLIHCVSDDIAFVAQKYGISKNKCFVIRPSIDTKFLKKQYLKKK